MSDKQPSSVCYRHRIFGFLPSSPLMRRIKSSQNRPPPKHCNMQEQHQFPGLFVGPFLSCYHRRHHRLLRPSAPSSSSQGLERALFSSGGAVLSFRPKAPTCKDGPCFGLALFLSVCVSSRRRRRRSQIPETEEDRTHLCLSSHQKIEGWTNEGGGRGNWLEEDSQGPLLTLSRGWPSRKGRERVREQSR